MRTITLDILDDHAFNLLKDLEKLKVIRLRKDETTIDSELSKKKVSFDAVSIDTRNFKFDRNEITN